MIPIWSWISFSRIIGIWLGDACKEYKGKNGGGNVKVIVAGVVLLYALFLAPIMLRLRSYIKAGQSEALGSLGYYDQKGYGQESAGDKAGFIAAISLYIILMVVYGKYGSKNIMKRDDHYRKQTDKKAYLTGPSRYRLTLTHNQNPSYPR